MTTTQAPGSPPADRPSRTSSAIHQIITSQRWIDRQLDRGQDFISRAPVRLALFLLIIGRIVGGAVYSLVEKEANWFDGAWWAVVTQTTVGYGDFAPETVVGRLTAELVMWTAILAVAIVTASFAGAIAESRINKHSETPELDDDIDHLISQMEALKAAVKDPRVEKALRLAHEDQQRRRV